MLIKVDSQVPRERGWYAPPKMRSAVHGELSVLIAPRQGVEMRVTTTIFMLESSVQDIEARSAAFTQEYLQSADLNAELELRNFVSLYSGQNRMRGKEASASEEA